MEMHELPAGWEWRRLADLTMPKEVWNQSKNPRAAFRYIDISSIDNVAGQILDAREIPGSIAPSRAKRIMRSGDVLFATTRPYLKNVAIVPPALDGEICSTGFCVLRPRLGNSQDAWCAMTEWVYYACRSELVVDQVIPNQEKSAYPAVSDNEVLAAQIPVPPLSEQRRIIARIEDVWSRVRQTLRFHHAAVEAQGSLLQSFVDRAFADTPEVSWIPIGNHARLQNGFAFKSGDFQSSGIRLLRNQNVYHDWIDWSDTKFLSQQQAKAYSVFELREGDVVLTLNRPIISTGIKAARVRTSDLPSLMVQRVGRFHCDGHLDKDYLFHFLTSTFFKDELGKIEEGGGVPSFTQRHIHPIRVPIRPITEQRRIAASLDHFRQEIPRFAASLQEIHAEIRTFMPAFLAKAFRGEL